MFYFKFKSKEIQPEKKNDNHYSRQKKRRLCFLVNILQLKSEEAKSNRKLMHGIIKLD